MPQSTIYLDDDVLHQVDAATKSSGISRSKWIADAVRLRANKEWPEAVRALAGAWADFPTVEQIRRSYGSDTRREKF
jgi:hypothetical protein